MQSNYLKEENQVDKIIYISHAKNRLIKNKNQNQIIKSLIIFFIKL